MRAAGSPHVESSSHFPSAWRRRPATALIFAVALASTLLCPGLDDGNAVSIAVQPEQGAEVVVVSLAPLGFPVKDEIASVTPPREQPSILPVWAPAPLALRAERERRVASLAAVDGEAVAAIPQSTGKAPLAVDYRALAQLAAVLDLQQLQQDAELTRTIVGTASTYNPLRDGKEEGAVQTASGEPYDPAAWTAAVQIHLRGQFGGVRYGRSYRPSFALVESGGKQVIVRINDVGPLKAGRVVDLNERAMRYFDPLLRRGLLRDVRLTLLPGEDWTPGPIGGARLIGLASAE